MFKNIRNKHLKYIYKIRDFILSLKKKKKNLYWELGSSRFVSNFKSSRKPGTYEHSGKRSKII